MTATPTDPRPGVIYLGFLSGVVVFFLLGLALAAALGDLGWPATIASFFVALFAGGAIGTLVALRLDDARHP
jgi:hypothetical protein